MNVLIVAEKPSLGAAIQTAIDSMTEAQKNEMAKHLSIFNPGVSGGLRCDVLALHGHIMRAKEPVEYDEAWGVPWKREVLPMIPAKFQFDVGDRDRATYNRLQDAVKSGKYDFLVNACDPDREGEAIFWTPIHNIGYGGPILRLYNHDATTEQYIKALINLLPYTPNGDLVRLRNASLFRVMFDWEVGMNASRSASMSLHLKPKGGVLAVGRVKTPVVSIVVKRDKEIENFASKTYFEIIADFGSFKARWFDDDITSVDTVEKSEEIVRLSGLEGIVKDVRTEHRKILPPQLFSLSELQKTANRQFGMSAQKVLDTVQTLYEMKVVSYPRTDARVLPTDKASDLPAMLSALSVVPEVASAAAGIDSSRIRTVTGNKRYFDNQKITAHHALVNTKIKPDLTKLSDDQRNIYLLIVKRFVGMFLDPYEYDETTVIVNMNGQTYKAVNRKTTAQGWQKLTGTDDEKTESESGESEGTFPTLQIGETIPARSVVPSEKATKAPPHYTDATLIADMTNCAKFTTDPQIKAVLKGKGGLGTEATRAGLIEDCVKKGLLIRKGKQILSSSEAQSMIAAMDSIDLTAPDLTAVWEMKLQSVEAGEMTSAEFKTAMENYVRTLTDTMLSLRQVYVAQSVGHCPLCGKDVWAGKNSYYCSSYDKETGVGCWSVSKKILGANVTERDAKAILAGRKSALKTFTSEKTKKKFKAMLYLNEEHRLAFEMPSVREHIGICPVCGAGVIRNGQWIFCEKHDRSDPQSCRFHASVHILGTDIPTPEIQKMLNGELSSEMEFVSKKTGKPFKAKLNLSPEGKFGFVFGEPTIQP